MNADRYVDPYSSTSAENGETPSGPGESSDSSPAAARLLEMVARETDEWRSEARTEAAAIVAGAREESARLVRAARVEADRLVTEAREQAAQATNDARVEAYRVREQTTALRERHAEEVARLEQIASEHREHLRGHLAEMLERVDAATPGPRDQ
ncbi:MULTISPECIES: hypothetical protein [unclassified Nocardioides]|uniref:hypothetical protein n=1 Tax=unclassified Nocardioides TaxID=2615069 RepID=UPI00361683B9